MKLGVLGGTFNPPHVGHLIAAEHVRTEMGLDRVLFVPAATPPHKLSAGIVSAEHRAAMLRHAIAGNPHFEISGVEIDRGGVSFTVDTLRELGRRFQSELFLLIGMDNLLEFHTWKSPEDIFGLASVVVMTRPGFSLLDISREISDRIKVCPVPQIEIASSDIRYRIDTGMSVRYLIPDAVARYIQEHSLYRTK